STGTYDILDNSGIGLGASTASWVGDAGLFEKTGGTGTSVIAPTFYEPGTGTVREDPSKPTSGTRLLPWVSDGKPHTGPRNRRRLQRRGRSRSRKGRLGNAVLLGACEHFRRRDHRLRN